MKKCKTIIALCLTAVLLSGGIMSASAEEYVANVVNEDFSSAANCNFLAPGDIDANGRVNADDLAILKKILLSQSGTGKYGDVFAAIGKTAKYSDVNGDGTVNIIDLIRQKKNAASDFSFIRDETMNLNGNSAYAADFISLLGTGASYEISYNYKSDSNIRVVISGLGEDIVFEEEPALNFTAVKHTFKTPLSIGESAGTELKVIGVGQIGEFKCTRINMDNEFTENW